MGKMGKANDECPTCGSDKTFVDTATGDLLCSNCGTVLHQHMIDHGQEWRAFNNDERERKSRVGAPSTLTMHDKGLSTKIGIRDVDAHGKALPPYMREVAKKLRKWNSHMRANSSMDRNLTRAMYELERICSQLNLSRSVKERAAHIYRKAIKYNLIRGRSIESMIAACTYTSCRCFCLPILYEDILAVSQVKRKDLHRCFRLIFEHIHIIPINSPKNFLSRYSSELGLSSQTQGIAAEILDFAIKLKIIGGRDPSGLAAAALYIAAILNNEKRTQHAVADVAKITEVTVRNRYKDLVKALSPHGLNINI